MWVVHYIVNCNNDNSNINNETLERNKVKAAKKRGRMLIKLKWELKLNKRKNYILFYSVRLGKRQVYLYSNTINNNNKLQYLLLLYCVMGKNRYYNVRIVPIFKMFHSDQQMRDVSLSSRMDEV